jgi:hypothetical protein
MAKRFSYYYLQFNSGRAWETLEQSESVAVLTSGLADQLASPTDSEIRIVGANFDPQSERWGYEQLFYIDQSSIDLGIAEESEFGGHQTLGANDSGPPAVGGAGHDFASPAETDEDAGPGPAITALMREREETDDAGAASDGDEDNAAPPWMNQDEADEQNLTDRDEDAELEEAVPWLRARDETDDADQDATEPFHFDTTPPRRRITVGKIIGFVFVVLFLAVWVVIGALVYLQHPLLLDTADKLGIGQYLRLGTHTDGSNTDSHASSMEADKGATPLVEPLTTGQVVRYVGVAPALRGRWSPRKCETTYIAFDEDGYIRSIDGQAAAGKTEISETLEDDFVFYLRRSPEMVEHYRKVTANDIQLAGATTESGFLGSSGKVEIYSRCP